MASAVHDGVRRLAFTASSTFRSPLEAPTRSRPSRVVAVLRWLRADSRSRPHRARGLDDQRELGPLHVLAEEVALHGRREPALRAERELVEGHVAAGLVDPSA